MAATKMHEACIEERFQGQTPGSSVEHFILCQARRENIVDNGRASEDREGRMEEVKAHCERCYDDNYEITLMQEVRIQEQ